jgi:hypothetical protein
MSKVAPRIPIPPISDSYDEILGEHCNGLATIRRFYKSKAGEPVIVIDWNSIQRRYGCELPDEARNTISDLVEVFVFFVEVEHSASMISDVKREIERIQSAAEKARNAFLQEPFAIGQLGAEYAAELINRHFCLIDPRLRDPRIFEPNKLRVAGETMAALCQACAAALDDAQKVENHSRRPGGLWEAWVRHVSKALAKHDLPVTVRKDYKRASPFVALVGELQNCVPKQYRKGLQSEPALAEAIYRALHDRVTIGSTEGQ